VKSESGETVTADAKPWDIRDRTFEFALAIVRLCRALETRSPATGILSRQLLRSGTAIGANVEEAQAGQSRADFISKYAIALKEARETIYWLRLLAASEKAPGSKYGALANEAKEIAKVIGAIIVKTKSRGGR
jgi:four helix bundle protein